MQADLFNRVVHQLSIREIEVYAWMPMLSIVLPDKDENESLRVKEFRNGEKRLSTSWYERLSPFSPQARRKLVMLYEDMASNARINGVVFQDDGYLNDFEDFHPAACEEYRKISGDDNIPYQELNPEQKRRWMRLKTKTLIELSEKLKEAVLRYRPDALFVRTLYAPVLIEPESEEWFAQNYANSLKVYDYVMIMAYPKMEKINRPVRWLKKLVQEAKKYPGGLQQTVFKVQTYDWEKKRWININTVDKWLRVLVASGVQHVGYYPDNYIENRPEERIIRMMMSVEDFPFKRR
jgi:biofilm PGA synthesis lipoprotein PgaB